MKNLFASLIFLMSLSPANADISAFEMTINMTMADLYCNYEMPVEVIEPVAAEAASLAKLDVKTLARLAVKQADIRAESMSAVEMREFCEKVRSFYYKLGYYFY